jgi:hypothetical protein
MRGINKKKKKKKKTRKGRTIRFPSPAFSSAVVEAAQGLWSLTEGVVAPAVHAVAEPSHFCAAASSD